MAVATLFFISGAMLLVSQAFTIGLLTKTPDTATQTPAYRKERLTKDSKRMYPIRQIRAPAMA
jgi:hypothetical protein